MRAAVVGAGAIGAAFDVPGQPNPMTHAGGYRAANCELVALVDTAESVVQEAERWGARPYHDLSRMLVECRPEVISFAVPATPRPALMLQALACESVRTVIAEKPLATTSSAARAVIDAFRERRVPLIVNYSRRFVPFWQEIAGRLAISATIKYAKGIVHNGSHAIDLCRMLFGECLGMRAISSKHDFWPDDPTVTARLSFEGCPEVILQSMDERCFTLFEVDIVGADWRAVVHHDGRLARLYQLQEGAGIPPGRRLVQIAERDTGSDEAMIRLIRHALEVARGGAVACSGEDALEALVIAEHLSEGGV